MGRKRRVDINSESSVLRYIVERTEELDLGYETPCRIWPGQESSRYIHTTIHTEEGRINVSVHRLAIWHREGCSFSLCGDSCLPSAHHLCHNKHCCNPDHIALLHSGTEHYLEERKIGFKRWSEKLTPDNVIEIRSLHSDGLPVGHLAKRFQCTESNIWSILCSDTWKHVA